MTGTKKSGSGVSSQPQNVPRFRNALDMNSIKPHQSAKADTFPEVIALGTDVVAAERQGTTMTVNSAKKAVKRHEIHSMNSEGGFLVNFLYTAIIKEKREVIYDTREGAIDKAWEDEYIIGVWDSPFISNALSGILGQNATKDKVTFDPTNIMSIPKPDITYGLMRDAFTEPQLRVLDRYVDLYNVHPFAISAFLVVECKSYNKNIAYAEIQAQRAGAALVCAQRQINHLTNCLHDKGEMDLRSIVFSLCIDLNCAKLNVHFITIQKDGLRYHHHNIKGYSFVQRNSFEDLRHDLWNIMDWGFGPHKEHVIRTLDILKNIDADKIWPAEQASNAKSTNEKTPSTTT